MPPTDFMTVIVQQLVPILGALGVAGLITQWFAAAKDRRTSRADVLTALAAVESARWANDGETTDYQRLRSALRELETALLVARLPRSMITAYAPLAFACLWYVHGEMERYGCDPEEASIDPQLNRTVRYAAETVSRAAWTGPVIRHITIPWRRLRLNRRVRKLSDERITSLLTRARSVME